MIVIAVVVLIALAPRGGETCDSSKCCCVDSATVTQTEDSLRDLRVSVEVSRSGNSCQGTINSACTASGDTICRSLDFFAFRSGKIAYYVVYTNDDTCNWQLSCDSGSCASSSDWKGKYSKTSRSPDPWPPRCDPKKCCCAATASVTATGSSLTFSYKPTNDSTGCTSTSLSCQKEGNLYLVCGSGNDAIVIKKDGTTNYVYQYRQECNSIFQCTSGDCTKEGFFTGDYVYASGSVPAWSFAAALVFAIAMLAYSY